MLVLFWYNTRKVEKAVIPILQGIEFLARGKPVTLPQKGELAEINMGLNHAGQHIIKKDKTHGGNIIYENLPVGGLSWL